jgi:hypothetical protein
MPLILPFLLLRPVHILNENTNYPRQNRQKVIVSSVGI